MSSRPLLLRGAGSRGQLWQGSGRRRSRRRLLGKDRLPLLSRACVHLQGREMPQSSLTAFCLLFQETAELQGEPPPPPSFPPPTAGGSPRLAPHPAQVYQPGCGLRVRSVKFTAEELHFNSEKALPHLNRHSKRLQDESSQIEVFDHIVCRTPRRFFGNLGVSVSSCP
ncbi:uncharacterized protein LOC141944856 isoform X2 [Strix uralensis]|uniref:uncharacterized protein LOC141944856 isoform X2 n=1 Tax=Strix uralensis TaxID=36305 RepID=UPI003DA79DC8